MTVVIDTTEIAGAAWQHVRTLTYTCTHAYTCAPTHRAINTDDADVCPSARKLEATS